MSSFSIHCTTCKSRLKVRDESAIGQIVGCPKCGSMVLIEVPAESSPADSSIGSTSGVALLPDTVADSKFGQSFEEAASWFEESPEDALAADSPETLDGSPPPLPEPAAKIASPPPLKPQPAYVTPPLAPPPPAEQFGADLSADASLPADTWTSPAAQYTRRIGLVAGAAVLGVIGVVGLALFVTSGDRTEQTAQPVSLPKPIAANVDSDNGDPPPVAPPAEEPDALPETPLPVEQPAVPAPVEVVANEPPAEPLPPSEPAEPVAAENLPPSEPIASQEPPPAGANEPVPPLFAENPGEAPPANTNSGLAALDALLPFLDGDPVQEPPPAEAPPAEATPVENEPQPPAPGEVASLPAATTDLIPVKPEPRQINLAARLNDPILALEIPNTPLIDFLRLMSDFSTIPITLDPNALAQLKLTPDQELTLVMGTTTVGEVLNKAAARVNLIVEPGNGQLIVTHNRNAGGPLRQAKYTVSDLVGTTSQDLSQLRQLVITQIAPGTWQETGGTGTIEAVPGALLVRHTEPVHHQLVLFVEKLRLARGLPLRSSYDPLLFDHQSRSAAFEPTLAKTISLNYFEPARMLTIVGRLEKIAEIRMLMDWESLLLEGWTPDTEATLSVADAPLAEALDQLLTPRGLTFRVIDRSTIQVTTVAALTKNREVEFYPASDLLTRNNWKIADLQTALLPQLSVADDVVRPILGFDPPSGHLVVSASAATHAKIGRLLTEL